MQLDIEGGLPVKVLTFEKAELIEWRQRNEAAKQVLSSVDALGKLLAGERGLSRNPEPSPLIGQNVLTGLVRLRHASEGGVVRQEDIVDVLPHFLFAEQQKAFVVGIVAVVPYYLISVKLPLLLPVHQRHRPLCVVGCRRPDESLPFVLAYIAVRHTREALLVELHFSAKLIEVSGGQNAALHRFKVYRRHFVEHRHVELLARDGQMYQQRFVHEVLDLHNLDVGDAVVQVEFEAQIFAAGLVQGPTILLVVWTRRQRYPPLEIHKFKLTIRIQAAIPEHPTPESKGLELGIYMLADKLLGGFL